MALAYSEVLYNFVSSYSAPVIALYLLMVLCSGRLMKMLPALDLRRPLMIHNLICSAVSLYAVGCFLIGFWQVRDFFSKKRYGGIIQHSFMIYWLSKLYELLDTVFMILRHRGRQITLLHVFHHSTITLLADWGYFIAPIPAVIPVLALNSFIHVVMYGYYFLTALFPLHDFAWKKRITQLQIVQFLLASLHGVIGYVSHGFCIYCLFYAFSMLALFSNFYYRAFVLKKHSRSIQKGLHDEASEKKGK